MEQIFSPQAWIGLLTLTVLEIVLGIDNIVFISILASKLPANQAARARQIGIGVALITRILLLLSLTWIIRLTDPIFTVIGQEISGRDIILIAGGLFLLGKSTREIHERLEGEDAHGRPKIIPTFSGVIIQIALLDMIFSLDSVITAVGMANQLWVMITAVIIAIGIMLASAGTIMDFVNRHPTVKMLALSFLLLIGFSLIVEALEFHIPKGYIYFAMGFSIFVEMLNLRAKTITAKEAGPVHLRTPYIHEEIDGG